MVNTTNNSCQKVIITVRMEPTFFNLDSLTNYRPYIEGCFDVYKQYLEKNGSLLFTNQVFLDYLRNELSVENEVREPFFFFQAKKDEDFSYETVYKDDNFNKWLESEGNKNRFLYKLEETKQQFLIRKHNDHEIYVLPVLNSNFDTLNSQYIETVIKTLKKEDDDLYLLLHDKDLYNFSNKFHRVAPNDGHVLLNSESTLLSLIDSIKVFVFYHQDDDPFYTEIIKRLDGLKIDEIIEKMKEQARLELFANELAEKIEISNIRGMMDKKRKESELYDFSKPFIF